MPESKEILRGDDQIATALGLSVDALRKRLRQELAGEKPEFLTRMIGHDNGTRVALRCDLIESYRSLIGQKSKGRTKK